VDPRTARKWASDTTDRRSGAIRSGAPLRLTDEILDTVVEWLERRGFPAKTEHWQDVCNQLNLPIGAKQLQRRMKKRGYEKFKAAKGSYITNKDKIRRLEFALKHIWIAEDLWHATKFTDESHIPILNQNNKWVIRQEGQRFEPDHILHKRPRKPAYFHV